MSSSHCLNSAVNKVTGLRLSRRRLILMSSIELLTTLYSTFCVSVCPEGGVPSFVAILLLLAPFFSNHGSND